MVLGGNEEGVFVLADRVEAFAVRDKSKVRGYMQKDIKRLRAEILGASVLQSLYIDP